MNDPFSAILVTGYTRSGYTKKWGIMTKDLKSMVRFSMHVCLIGGYRLKQCRRHAVKQIKRHFFPRSCRIVEL